MTNPEAERLHVIHERMTTYPALVGAIAAAVTGEPTAPISRITIGETNEVYEVRSSQELILRINHTTPENFDREEWALDQALAAGLPVPKIVRRGVVEDQGDRRYYEVQGKLPGIPFATLIDRGMPLEQCRMVTREAGSMLARLHRVPTEGFGDIDATGKGEHPTLQAWFTRITSKQAQLHKVFEDAGRDPAVCSRAVGLLRSADPLFEGAKPHLVHDDFAPKHVLVTYDDGLPHVSGLLDFELAKSGYLGHELPEWQLRHAASAPIQWLLEGYGGMGTPANMERQRITALHKYLVLLDYYAIEEPSPNMSRVCLDGIDQFVRSGL